MENERSSMMDGNMHGVEGMLQHPERLSGGSAKPPAWATMMRPWTNYVVYDFAGGPRPWKFAWVINFQRIGTLPFLALLIALYHNTTAAAWIYLAMHGTSGLVWIIKDLAFPDPSWQIRVTSPAPSTLPLRARLVLGLRLADLRPPGRRIRSRKMLGFVGSSRQPNDLASVQVTAGQVDEALPNFRAALAAIEFVHNESSERLAGRYTAALGMR
jgi:hypothetical protein